VSRAEALSITAELATGTNLGDQAAWHQLVECYGSMCGRLPAASTVFMMQPMSAG
jgi:hypothetical protein